MIKLINILGVCEVYPCLHYVVQLRKNYVNMYTLDPRISDNLSKDWLSFVKMLIII